MMDFKKVNGAIYWMGFIEIYRLKSEIFKGNPRFSLMTKTLQKLIQIEKKRYLI